MKVKTIELNCKRCQHKWHPRKGEVIVCPRCHSPYWNKEKVAEELDKKLGTENEKEK